MILIENPIYQYSHVILPIGPALKVSTLVYVHSIFRLQWDCMLFTMQKQFILIQ